VPSAAVPFLAHRRCAGVGAGAVHLCTVVCNPRQKSSRSLKRRHTLVNIQPYIRAVLSVNVSQNAPVIQCCGVLMSNVGCRILPTVPVHIKLYCHFTHASQMFLGNFVWFSDLTMNGLIECNCLVTPRMTGLNNTLYHTYGSSKNAHNGADTCSWLFSSVAPFPSCQMPARCSIWPPNPRQLKLAHDVVVNCGRFAKLRYW
jgi:hypothetical protein